MTKPQKILTKPQINEIFKILAENIIPKSELNWNTPLDLLVAVVLSAQTTDKAVNKISKKLFKICKTPQDYLNLGEQKLRQHIRTIGLFNNKTKSVLGICNLLQEKYNNKIPNNRKQLMTLPGVGRKTANVILNVLFNQPVMAVDTHVFRISNRIGLVQAKNVSQTEAQLMNIIPKKYLLHAHHYLILHGRYTCKARNPQCQTCIINHLCLKNI